MSHPRRVALAATVAALVIVTGQMLALGTNASLYLSFGRDSADTLAFGEARLGDVYVKPGLGHDGRLFYIAAHDPFLLDPGLYQDLFERPVYRSQRMLLPVLAAPAGLVGEWPLAWWMLILNLGAVAAGTYVTAAIAGEMGLSAWFGFAFAANPGVWAELNAGGSGAIAWALAAAAVLAVHRHRAGWSIGLLVLAALSREAMLVVAAGLAAYLWRRRRSWAVRILLIPAAAVAVWAIYVRLRLGEPIWATQSREFSAPLVGLVEAAGEWIERADPLRATVGGLYAVMAVRFLLLARSTRHLLGWAVGGFALLMPFLSAVVWFDVWDISRALLPLVTVYVLLAGLAARPTSSTSTARPDTRW